MKKTLVPRTVIDIEGKLVYNENFQAWNTIRLKKDLFNEFPELKEKRSKFSYKMLYFRTFKELLKEIKNQQNKEIFPVLMWFYKDG